MCVASARSRFLKISSVSRVSPKLPSQMESNIYFPPYMNAWSGSFSFVQTFPDARSLVVLPRGEIFVVLAKRPPPRNPSRAL